MKPRNTSLQISFNGLAVLKGDSEPLPLSALTEDCHVHGELQIRIGDSLLPHLGYLGPDDVCFSTWLVELDNVLKEFEGKRIAQYLFDEGEQGQPAFLFEREGEQMFLSIIHSEISEGKGDHKCQKVAFTYLEFVNQVKRLQSSFLTELKMEAPATYKKWIASLLTTG
jgi:hypothetical protein